MGYIGPAPKFGDHQKQVITGDSSTVTFTLDYYVTDANSIMVIYNGVIQEPGTGKAYTTSGNSITFSVAPTTGSTCWIIFLGIRYDVGTVADGAITAAKLSSGMVVQTVYTQSGAVSTGTTVMVHDDSIPQNTEGDEYMTLAITPTNASNILVIEHVGTYAASNANELFIVALFQDSTAGALAAMSNENNNNGSPRAHVLTHHMVAGTASETTFKIRAGQPTAGTTTFNGSGGARVLGGVLASFLKITEIVV